jgi:glycerol-3-phosphate dehydrogenase
MWGKDSRDSIWNSIDLPWDVMVIGGGSSGAGIFNYAARAGLRVLLVEANDYAFGASGRTGKHLHGRVKSTAGGRFSAPVELANEREKLLDEAPYLIRAASLYRAAYRGEAGAWRQFNPLLAGDIRHEFPILRAEDLRGGQRYDGATVDDARLVLRLIREGVSFGGVAINYVRAAQLLFTRDGLVCGAVLRDRAQGEDGRTVEALARVVVNAAGSWCDVLRAKAGGKALLRQKIGSYLFLPAARLPLTTCLTVMHPDDGQPLYFTPWEGVVAVGGKDMDYFLPADVAEPAVSAQEIEYLLEGMRFAFPGLDLGLRDVTSCHAGAQAVLMEDTGIAASESGILLEENGLVTATTGKLCMFRLAASQTLNLLRTRLPGLRPFDPNRQVFERMGEMPYSTTLDPAGWAYLAGRYGRELPTLLANTPAEELQPIYPQLPGMWAELRWAARDGAVMHLDDLLLRRLRLGLMVKRGGLNEIDDLRPFIQPELGWDNIRWQWEVARYSRIHELYYSV